MSRTPGLRAIVMLVLAAACWGLATVMSKAVLGQVPPLTLLVVQLGASAVLLWTLVVQRRVQVPPARDAIRLGLTGLLNPGLANTFGLLGLSLTSASAATLIWAAEPILILSLAWLLLCERLTRPFIALSLLAILGVTLVSRVDPGAGLNSPLVGNALVLTGVFFCALYVVLTRRLVVVHDPLLLVALQQTVALAWALALWPVELVRGGAAGLGAVEPGVWTWAVASGLLYYALAFWCYLSGLKEMPASRAGLFLNLIPLFGLAGAALFLAERLSPLQWAGALLIFAAVLGTTRLRATEPVGEPLAG